jgi:hypothetical protein
MIIELLQSKGFTQDVDFSFDGEVLAALDKTRPVEQVIQHEEVPAVFEEVEILDENQESFDPPQFEQVEVSAAIPAWEETITVQETYQEELPSLASLKLELVRSNDPAYLIGEYLKTQEAAEPDDSLNLELFLKGGNGWRFANIPAPSVDELFDLIEISNADKSQAEINKESLAYLSSTDWMIIREVDQGIVCPSDVRAARQAARDRIVR